MPTSEKGQHFKSYICLFICMCTKAVHLELVSNLSSEAFLAALRRFVARRGYPTDIFSDNGTNCVGATAYLKALFKLPREPSVQDFCSQKSITWHFISPYAPNFGGLWEASIKLAKRHLTRTCQGTLVTFEEMCTLLCQIEACINSRPLVPLSTETTDLRALTPGHFLIGVPLLEIPESNHQSNPSLSLSSRWKILLQMRGSFWRRWTRDYLHALQPRPKWRLQNKSINVGDLVLLKDGQQPPLQWNFGRVTQLFSGTDQLTRVVSVKTKSGDVIRTLNRLVVLPISSSLPPQDVE